MVNGQWLMVNDKIMRENIIKQKSFSFAVRIIKLYQYLCDEKKEFVLSKQLLRSGTSVGAMVREAEHAESKPDFKHKMAIAQKEINESIYWLELMKETGYLNQNEFESLNTDAIEIIKLITSIIKTSKIKR
jgi:four helix bundle protein